MTTLSNWRDALDDVVDSCPWPGVRPLDRPEDQRDRLLAGREDDKRTFTRLVLNNDVVVLTGRTGVGKSSLLSSGLRPALERRYFEVITCNFSRLLRDTAGTTASELLTNLADRLPEGITRGEGSEPLAAQLDRHYANTAVVVLDQFEELIRYQPQMYPLILDWIHDTASRTHVRIVISLRIEFEHQLHGHGGLNLGPFQQARLELLPVFEPAEITKIIYNKRVTDAVITPDAAEALLDMWQRSGAVDGRGDIGLLHLQAALCVLWSRVQATCITREVVHDLLPLGGAESDVAAAFRRALADYVGQRLEQCRTACTAPGVAVDHILSARASELVIAVSRHLSSDGYKVPQSVDFLAKLVLFDETGGEPLSSGAHTAEGVAGITELARAFAETERRGDRDRRWEVPEADDWVGRPRTEIIGDKAFVEGWPWDLDPLSATGGPLLGLRGADSAVEEYRAFFFALEWLRSCALISTVAVGSNRTMVQLVHDGFDAGLRKWREGLAARATSAVDRVTAVHGAILSWMDTSMAGVNGSILTNLRWTSCDVTARFKDVVFVNCDFSRTSFRDCHFEGVVFVNCVLDDVEFARCDIIGKPNPAPNNLLPEQLQKQPSFHIEGLPEESLRAISRYRGTPYPAEPVVLYSETSGLAAEPAAIRAESDPRLVPFGADAPRSARQPGGLTMFGSRLSSLKFTGCDFGGDGWLALRHVAGTSVEIAELNNARVEVFAAALRGLTVTTPIDKDDEIGSDAFEMTFTEAQVLNTWFGHGLAGKATITASQVWQLFNGSERLEIVVKNSELFGPVNVGRQDESIDRRPPGWRRPDSLSLGDLAAEVEAASHKIDYRTHPAQFERERAE